MLYLVKPDGRMEWNDLPARTVLEAAAEHGADLSCLEWQPSERIADTTIAVALRYGVRCTGGIVLDAGYVAMQGQADEILTVHRNAAEAHAALKNHSAWMEQLIPGWTESGRQLDARIAESTARAVEDARADFDEVLNEREVDAELVAHWTALGGRVPST